MNGLSIGDYLVSLGVVQSVYVGSAPRVGRNATWNPSHQLVDPHQAGPRNFQRRYGFVNVGIDNPAWTGAFLAEQYSAGSFVGEELSPQAIEALARSEDNPFNLLNWRTFQVSAQDLTDLEYCADPDNPSQTIFSTKIADLLAARGLAGPKTKAPTGGATGPHREPGGGVAPPPPPPPPPAPAPVPQAPAPALALPPATPPAPLAPIATGGFTPEERAALAQLVEGRFPGEGGKVADVAELALAKDRKPIDIAKVLLPLLGVKDPRVLAFLDLAAAFG